MFSRFFQILGYCLLLLASPSLVLGTPIIGSPRRGDGAIFNSTGQQATRRLIQWGPCDDATVPRRLQCATLEVPLDYSHPLSNKTHALDLMRSPAVRQPSKGSVLFNFGGPGGDDITNFARFHDTRLKYMHAHTGDYYDHVVFRTRGSGKPMQFKCFDTPEQVEAASLKNSLRLPTKLEKLPLALEAAWAVSQGFACSCWNKNKESQMGDLIGTTFVARDMLEIVDSLGEDGLLRFWGFSYGTALGATFAAMFPDRINRMVLDGVVDVFNYYNGNFAIPNRHRKLKSAAYNAVLTQCLLAGPENCALAQDIDTSITDRSLSEQVEFLKLEIDDLKFRLGLSPIVVDNTTTLTRSTVADLETSLLRGRFAAAAHLHNLLNGENLDTVAPIPDKHHDSSDVLVRGLSEAFWGIRCADRISVDAVPETVDELVSQAMSIAQTSGKEPALHFAHQMLACASWPFAKNNGFGFDIGRLQAEGGLRTSGSPILLVGNTYDLVTPLFQAQTMNGRLADSVVLEQNSFGHGSLGQESTCTVEAIRRYFLHGVLPEPGTVCEVDRNPFVARKRKHPETNFILPWVPL